MNKRIKSFLRSFIPYGFLVKRRRKLDKERANTILCNSCPVFFNNEGNKIAVFYLSDELLGKEFYSYTQYRFPKKIFWDRCNCYLDVHFYAHDNIFIQEGKSKVRVAVLIETEQIDPKPYKALYENTELANSFDLILTHSSKLLKKYSHARFIPAGGVWYGSETYGGIMDDEAWKNKTRNISIVSSNKIMCKLHKLRYDLAWKLKNNPNVDTFGTFDGGDFKKISDTLTDYRFSIVIENTIDDYCFTEKILNCFASMTIPIYIGARKISDFFNSDGIIQITEDDCTNIEGILSLCNENYYNSKKDAILDNYKRVKSWTCQEDYIVEHYWDLINGIIRNK